MTPSSKDKRKRTLVSPDSLRRCLQENPQLLSSFVNISVNILVPVPLLMTQPPSFRIPSPQSLITGPEDYTTRDINIIHICCFLSFRLSRNSSQSLDSQLTVDTLLKQPIFCWPFSPMPEADKWNTKNIHPSWWICRLQRSRLWVDYCRRSWNDTSIK